MPIIDLDSRRRISVFDEVEESPAYSPVSHISVSQIAERVSEALPIFRARSNFAELLEKKHAGPEGIATVIADIMHNGGNDVSRLRAAELAMKGSGLLDNPGNNETQVVFNITGGNVQAILQPDRNNSEKVNSNE